MLFGSYPIPLYLPIIYRLSRQALRKVTWLSFTFCPFYVYEDCIGFCMSLLTIEHSGINARLKPTEPCDGSLISFPLVGQKGYKNDTKASIRHFCRAVVVGFEPTLTWVKAMRLTTWRYHILISLE